MSHVSRLDLVSEALSVTKFEGQALVLAALDDAASFLEAAALTYALVKDLPPAVQKALKHVGYGKRDIAIQPAEKFSLAFSGGESGVRDFNVLLDLASGRFEVEYGSWGGPNPFESGQKATGYDETMRPIPPNVLVIQGSEGGGRPVYAKILVSPKTMAPLLPSKSGEDLTEQEKSALRIIRGYISSYRKEEFPRAGLGAYGPQNEHIQSLAKKGLVKVASNGGVALTTEGKSAASGLR